MLWIRSDTSVGSHPKTRKLARRLDCSIPAAVGHLHLLWHWAAMYAQDGALDRHDAEDIAVGAQFDGDGAAFLEALIAAGFVDRDDNGIRIHDWFEHAGRLFAIQEARREAGRKGAQVRWGSHSKASGDANGQPMATNSTDVEDVEDVRTSPPQNGGDDAVEKVRAALRAEDFDEGDVEFACRRLTGELATNGRGITSPLAWARTVAKRQASHRQVERPEVKCPRCGTKTRLLVEGGVCTECYEVAAP